MKRHDTTWIGSILTALLIASSSLLGGCVAETADSADDVEPAAEQHVDETGSALTEEPASSPTRGVAPQSGGQPVGRPGAERTTDPQPDPWTGGCTDSSRDPQPDPWQPKTAKTK